jgi:Saxitoxin biosynthesis operon protein SxtJ
MEARQRSESDRPMNFLKRKITKDQSRDTGMAVVLLTLLLFIGRKWEGWLFVAIGLHVLNMIVPQVYRPVALLWLGLSDVLEAIVPRIVLAILFFAVVTPVGLFRRVLGKDPLKLRLFKSAEGSVMLQRHHLFVPEDLERPY